MTLPADVTRQAPTASTATPAVEVVGLRKEFRRGSRRGTPGPRVRRVAAIDDVTIRDYGSAAVTIATVTQKATFGGQRADGQFRVAHVFVRTGERWQIANVQYSMIGGPPPFARSAD